MFRRTLTRILRRAAWLGAALLVVCISLYGLALLALKDLRLAPDTMQHAAASGAATAVAMSDGRVKVRPEGEGGEIMVAGHATAVIEAEPVAGGHMLVSSEHGGTVRVTGLDHVAMLHEAGLPGLSARLHSALWQPYGSKLARLALDIVAQVLPLELPEHLRGRRGRAFRDCDICPQMVELRPGMFFMGSPWTEWDRESDEGPRRLVTISEPFAVGRFEVTTEEWDRCVADGRCRPIGSAAGGASDQGRRPVSAVTWEDAQAYVAWLTAKVGALGEKSSGTEKITYRLLSEAEWEYAARAGTTAPFAVGARISVADARFRGDGSGEGGPSSAGAVAPGRYVANAFGLHDMHGNVSEWVEDCWIDATPREATSLRNGAACERRVVRGGAWSDAPSLLRSAYRIWGNASGSNDGIGFRIARTLTR